MLLKITAVEQLGDLFTNGIPRAAFEYLQNKVMGCQLSPYSSNIIFKRKCGNSPQLVYSGNTQS